jgi:hypothetical protein
MILIAPLDFFDLEREKKSKKRVRIGYVDDIK